jgi:chromosome segregation ATPase
VEHIWLTICIVAGIVFGFLIAWFNFRSDRQNIYVSGKSDGEKERAALSERVASKETRIREITAERDAERAAADKLREEMATLRGAQNDYENRIAEVRQALEEKIAVAVEAERKSGEAFRSAVNDKVADLEDRLAAVTAEREKAKAEAESLRSENALLKAFQAEVDTRMEESRKFAEERLAAAQQSQQSIVESLKTLSAELLNTSTENFSKAAETAFEQWRQSAAAVSGEPSSAPAVPLNLDEILTPIREVLGKVGESLRKAESDHDADLKNAGKELYDRLLNHTEQVMELRRSLDEAVRSFNRGVGSLEGNVLLTARRLRDLVASDSPQIPVIEALDSVPREVNGLTNHKAGKWEDAVAAD